MRAAPVVPLRFYLPSSCSSFVGWWATKKRLTLPSRATMMTSWAACFDFTSFIIRGACRLLRNSVSKCNRRSSKILPSRQRGLSALTASWCAQTHISRWFVGERWRQQPRTLCNVKSDKSRWTAKAMNEPRVYFVSASRDDEHIGMFGILYRQNPWRDNHLNPSSRFIDPVICTQWKSAKFLRPDLTC